MRRFVLEAVVGWARRLFAVITAVLAVAGASYFVGHKLSNPDHYQRWGICSTPTTVIHVTIIRQFSCSPPTRYAWQIPLALVILFGGLGVAVVISGDRLRPRAAVKQPRLARA
jgi:hypothetical protein